MTALAASCSVCHSCEPTAPVGLRECICLKCAERIVAELRSRPSHDEVMKEMLEFALKRAEEEKRKAKPKDSG